MSWIYAHLYTGATEDNVSNVPRCFMFRDRPSYRKAKEWAVSMNYEMKQTHAGSASIILDVDEWLENQEQPQPKQLEMDL